MFRIRTEKCALPVKKTIYHASNEGKTRLALDRITEKWTAKYPNPLKHWYAITPIFKFSPDVRKVILTTNAIEGLNSTYRKLNRQRITFWLHFAETQGIYLINSIFFILLAYAVIFFLNVCITNAYANNS